MDFASLLRTLPPEFMTDTPAKRAFLRVLAGELDEHLSETRDSIAVRFPTLAPDDALDVLGQGRGLVRVPGEGVEAYRNRVVNAFTFWQEAGTLPGMYHALEHLGYGLRVGRILDGDPYALVAGILRETATSVTLQPINGDRARDTSTTVTVNGQTFTFDTVTFADDFRYYGQNPTRVVEHYQDDPAIWSEFTVYLSPTEPIYTTDTWGDGSVWDAPGDESRWDVTLGPLEPARIRQVIDLVKPGHSKLRKLYLVSKPDTDFWDQSASFWDDGSVWDGDLPVEL